MDIKLYHNNSLSNVVNKSITLVSTSSSAKFLEPYDEYAPVIRYRGKTNFDDVNYIVIEDSDLTNGFTRYYFIDGVTYKSPNIAIINCHLDVLMTYSTFIHGLKCYVTRCANMLGDPYMQADRPQRVYNNIERKLFKDANNNTVGFVVPGETKAEQAARGVYIINVLHDGYKDEVQPN